MTRYPVKIAKLAISNTYVGGIDIAVDLPGNAAMWYLLFPKFISQMDQVSEGSMVIKVNAF